MHEGQEGDRPLLNVALLVFRHKKDEEKCPASMPLGFLEGCPRVALFFVPISLFPPRV